MTKRTLMMIGLVVALVAVPVAALALQNARQDVEAPAVGDTPYPPDTAYGWMGDMHDSMWGNPDGTLPEGLPEDFPTWMNQMRDYMWGNPDGTLSPDASYGWMGDMHDSMWGNPDGTLPEDFPTWMNQMRDYMWGNPDGTLPEDLPSDVAPWMDQMRDGWWGNTDGVIPQPVPGSQGLVPSQSRVPAVTQDGTPAVGASVVPAGWNGGGCGMWGNR